MRWRWDCGLAGLAIAWLGSPDHRLGSLTPNRICRESTETIAIPPGVSLQLDNWNGDVTVTGWDRPEARLSISICAFAPERLAGVAAQIEFKGKRLHARAVYTDPLQWNLDRPRSPANPATIDWDVRVPRGTRLDSIAGVAGRVVIRRVDGPVTASATDGPLVAQDLAGPAELSSVHGDVVARFAQRPAGQVRIGSISGRVIVTLPAAPVGALALASTCGNVSSSWAPGRQSQGEGSIRLSSTFGDVILRGGSTERAWFKAGSPESSECVRSSHESMRSP